MSVENLILTKSPLGRGTSDGYVLPTLDGEIAQAKLNSQRIVIPPEDITGVAVDDVNYTLITWDASPSPRLVGYLVRYHSSDSIDWETATPFQAEPVEDNQFLAPFHLGRHTLLVKAIDELQSESITAATYFEEAYPALDPLTVSFEGPLSFTNEPRLLTLGNPELEPISFTLDRFTASPVLETLGNPELEPTSFTLESYTAEPKLQSLGNPELEPTSFTLESYTKIPYSRPSFGLVSITEASTFNKELEVVDAPRGVRPASLTLSTGFNSQIDILDDGSSLRPLLITKPNGFNKEIDLTEAPRGLRPVSIGLPTGFNTQIQVP